MVWNGSEDLSYWNKRILNWLDRNGQEVSYQDGDSVNFRDSGSGKVMLLEPLAPSIVLVNNSVGHDYTFAYGGGLTGTMTLIKGGEGKLTIETSNDYTGETIISKGTLVLGNAKALDQRSRVTLNVDSATLDLGTHTLSNNVTVSGTNASIGNGTLEGRLTIYSTSFTWSDDSLILVGEVELNNNATLDLGMHTLSAFVTLSGTNATIGNGTINGNLAVADNKSLALLANTTVTGGVSLGAQSSLNLGGNTFHTGGEGGSQVTFSGDATVSNGTLVLDSDWSPGYALTFTDITLDLNKHTLSKAVTLVGDNAIGNGTIEGDLTVTSGSRINLLENTTITGGVTLGDNASLNLGKNAISASVTLSGSSATIGNGTVKLLADLTGEGTIVFGEDTMVDMNGHTLSRAFSLAGDTTFTNGKVRLTDNVSGEGTFILGEGVTLDTNFRTISNKITLSGSTVTILGGNFDNDLTVGKGQTLIVTGTFMTGKGTLYLGDGATLRQKPTPISSSYITNAVMVTGNATIDNGNLSSWVTVAPGVKLTVSGSLNMANSSSIALQDGAILDLGGGSDINARVYVGGDAFVGNGCVNKEILVNSLRKLTLFDSLTCIDIGSQETSTGITLQNNAAVDLGGKTHIIDVRAYGNASIGNGTLDGSVTANHDSSLNFFGETRIKGGTQIPGGTQNPDKTATSGLVTVGNTTIKSLDNANPGLLKELSVSNGLIAGTDRCTSLADGLYIESTAALMIKNMTITANNELHAGYMLTNTVTLNQVTIDLSEANFTLVGSDYYFQVQSLINCTLEMDDVVFDASALELPEDFDPAKNGIGFDFGDDVFIGKTEATLLMGDHWSQTVSLGDRGQMVFSALVPMTPEPTTGTLSLLALAALAARRRRK